MANESLDGKLYVEVGTCGGCHAFGQVVVFEPRDPDARAPRPLCLHDFATAMIELGQHTVMGELLQAAVGQMMAPEPTDAPDGDVPVHIGAYL